MKLAILTFDFPPHIGGVQTYLYEIARRLAETHEVCIITPVAGRLPAQERLRIVAPKGFRAVGYWRALRALKPDRVLVGHAHPQLMLASSLASTSPYATLVHGNDVLAAQQRWHRSLFNRLLNRSRPLLANSKATSQRLHQLGLAPWMMIQPGTDPLRFQPKAEQSVHRRLLTVGRLVPRKGIDTVIQALPSLRKNFPDLHYVVAGSGPDRTRLEQLARTHGVADVVQFRGRVADDDLPELYRQATLFVMPAREEEGANSVEGFGIVYLEASASGLPVIAGRSGGAVEAVREGETGFLVEPNDPQALAQTIARLLADPDLRRRMGRAGRAWVETEMNWDRTARQMATALGLDS